MRKRGGENFVYDNLLIQLLSFLVRVVSKNSALRRLVFN